LGNIIQTMSGQLNMYNGAAQYFCKLSRVWSKWLAEFSFYEHFDDMPVKYRHFSQV